MDGIEVIVALFGLAVAIALVAVEANKPALLALAKPLATVSLLGVVGLPPADQFSTLVAAGLVLSTGGDIALLVDRPAAFLLGIALFLAAHLAYATAFLMAGPGGLAPVLGVIIFGGASIWLVRRLRPGVPDGLRVPVVFYAGAITVMAGAALATLSHPHLPLGATAAAAAGAAIFYASDSVFSWHRFLGPVRHGQTVTLALYWAGQFGIALAARWAAHG